MQTIEALRTSPMLASRERSLWGAAR